VGAVLFGDRSDKLRENPKPLEGTRSLQGIVRDDANKTFLMEGTK
jgi:hypothetical protein